MDIDNASHFKIAPHSGASALLTAVHAHDLTVSRGERTLFRNLSFSLNLGEILTLTGANGAGKTSLLRAIAGFIRPDAGRIIFDGVEADATAGRCLHFLGHLDGLKTGRTAGEELAFQCRYLGGSDEAADRAAETLHLAPLLDLEVRKLSAGQRRRLAFARLIAAPRPVWLLDEPLAPLDARWREVFGQIMQAHLDRGGMILAAIHDPLPIPTRNLTVEAVR